MMSHDSDIGVEEVVRLGDGALPIVACEKAETKELWGVKPQESETQ
jgi:hypothetical protein